LVHLGIIFGIKGGRRKGEGKEERVRKEEKREEKDRYMKGRERKIE
jgi:hypothetical protein